MKLLQILASVIVVLLIANLCNNIYSDKKLNDRISLIEHAIGSSGNIDLGDIESKLDDINTNVESLNSKISGIGRNLDEVQSDVSGIRNTVGY